MRSASRRNSPTKSFSNTVTWVQGQHSINFGGSFFQVNTWAFSLNNLVPSLTFGVDATDPANAAMFTSANFPGATAAQISSAANLYAILVGRVTGVSGNAYLNENTGAYTPLGDYTERIRQREFGFFAQDAWRARPNLTLNYGLRWEVQKPFETLNTVYTQTEFNNVFGISGPGGLFNPRAAGGNANIRFNPFRPGDKAYNTDWNNFAPSVGFAYSPDWRGGILNRLFGTGGQSVLRAGYSIAYVREGTNVPSSILGANPGGSVSLSRTVALGNLTAGTLLRDLTPGNALLPSPGSPTFPLASTNINDSINVFHPDLKTGYVQSWTAGFQREITKDTVFEIRYVGTRGTKLWRQYNINETNVLENGFLDEFRLAQQNLAANNAFRNAQGQATRAGSFAYFGPGSGTSPLPIMLAYIRGCVPNAAGACTSTFDPNNAAQYNSTLFTNTTLVGRLSPFGAAPQSLASDLFNNAGRRANAISAGLTPNFFNVNPAFLGGGAFLVDNGGHTWYDALTLEMRQRMARGLLIQGSYTYGKSLTNLFSSSSVVADNYASLHDISLEKSISPFDIRHSFKANWIYELPFGRGKMWLGDANGLADRLTGGWEFHGAARVQSGTPFSLGNVQLVGLNLKELQNLVEIRKDPDAVRFFPQQFIDDTIRAFNFNATGYTRGAPQGPHLAPAGSNGCLPAYTGSCGVANVILYGPKFARFDLSVVKKTRLTEKSNIEFRTEFLNAFNNINFRIGSAANDVTSLTVGGDTFGQTTSAYQDTSTTNDPGARLIQFVLRINF